MTSAPAFRRPATVYAILAALASAWLAYILIRYGLLATYMGHAEPNVVVRAWHLAAGGALYETPDSPNFLLIAYGPVLFFVNAAFLALIGPSIAISKLAGILAAAAAAVVVAAHARRHYAGATGLAVLVFICFLFIAAPISFWTRPDSLLLLLVSVAVFAAVRDDGRETWRGPLIVAVCLGLAVNLKIHAFIYFAPIVIGYCRWRPVVTWPLMAVVSIGVFALPFALPQVSLTNYLQAIFGVAGGRPIVPELLWFSTKYAVLFVAPGLILLVGGRDGTAEQRRRLFYFAALLGAVAAGLYPSSVAGAFWYHLLPFAPITVDLLLRATHESARPGRAAIAATLFALTIAIVSVTPQKRLLRNYANLAWAPAAAAEIRQHLSRHPGRTMEIGYGHDVAETYKRTFLKPLLAFAGNPVTIDGFSDTEAHHVGLPVPPGKLAQIRDCATELWLIPAGERPFAMNGYYGGKAFWPEYTATFNERYGKREEHRFFDVWGCTNRS